jgi:hypothetical protein
MRHGSAVAGDMEIKGIKAGTMCEDIWVINRRCICYSNCADHSLECITEE